MIVCKNREREGVGGLANELRGSRLVFNHTVLSRLFFVKVLGPEDYIIKLILEV
jgi:hypothetical protein